MKSNKWQTLTSIRAKKEIDLLRTEFKRDVVMDKVEVEQVKSEIANLRRIASNLPPGAVKVALAKKAAELGKKISPFMQRKSA